MSEIFDETNMRQSLGNYIPEGEILLAGIHALAKEFKGEMRFRKVLSHGKRACSGRGRRQRCAGKGEIFDL